MRNIDVINAYFTRKYMVMCLKEKFRYLRKRGYKRLRRSVYTMTWCRARGQQRIHKQYPATPNISRGSSVFRIHANSMSASMRATLLYGRVGSALYDEWCKQAG